MRITYDPEADAAYFYMAVKTDVPETREVDGDINLDFDVAERLVGVEVLDASKRLDIDYLLPFLEIIGREEPGWRQLRVKLLRYKQAGTPVKTKTRGTKNWVEEVGRNHVSLRRDMTSALVGITRVDLENKDNDWHKHHRRLAIVKRLWEIGGYDELKGSTSADAMGPPPLTTAQS